MKEVMIKLEIERSIGVLFEIKKKHGDCTGILCSQCPLDCGTMITGILTEINKKIKQIQKILQ